MIKKSIVLTILFFLVLSTVPSVKAGGYSLPNDCPKSGVSVTRSCTLWKTSYGIAVIATVNIEAGNMPYRATLVLVWPDMLTGVVKKTSIGQGLVLDSKTPAGTLYHVIGYNGYASIKVKLTDREFAFYDAYVSSNYRPVDNAYSLWATLSNPKNHLISANGDSTVIDVFGSNIYSVYVTAARTGTLVKYSVAKGEYKYQMGSMNYSGSYLYDSSRGCKLSWNKVGSDIYTYQNSCGY